MAWSFLRPQRSSKPSSPKNIAVFRHQLLYFGNLIRLSLRQVELSFINQYSADAGFMLLPLFAFYTKCSGLHHWQGEVHGDPSLNILTILFDVIYKFAHIIDRRAAMVSKLRDYTYARLTRLPSCTADPIASAPFFKQLLTM